MTKALAMQPMSLAKVSVAWNTTSWLWGVRPSDFWSVGIGPNGAAYIKVISLGEVETWTVDATDLVEKLAATQVQHEQGIDGLTKALENLTGSQLQAMTASGLVFHYRKVRAEEVLFIPIGVIIIEKAEDGSLIYGVRKSFMLDGDKNRKRFDLIRDNLGKSGKTIKKYDQVLDLFSGS